MSRQTISCNLRKTRFSSRLITRVIRTTPLEEEESAADAAFCNNLFGTIAEVQSPMTCTDDISTPGDVRVKDPDWGQMKFKVKSEINKPSISR